jgi:hypothetical protein
VTLRATRAVAHVHSDWSYDGEWTLEDLARAFRRRRYRVLLMAEHDRGFTDARWDEYRAACAALSDRELLVVPGIEYGDADDVVHVVTWGDIPFFGEARPTEDVLNEVRRAGGVSFFAHPRRRDAWRRFDPAWARVLTGIEIWNRKYDGWAPYPRYADLVPPGSELLPLVALDFHERRQFFPLAMILETRGQVTEAAVVDAIAARRASPLVSRLPVERLRTGRGSDAAQAAERVRRHILRPARRRVDRLRDRALRRGRTP